jgi:hypothetical protein
VIKVDILRINWVGNVEGMEEKRGVCRVLVVKLEGKIPLGRSRRKWKYNIKIDFQEVGCGGMDWIKLAQDRGRWREILNAVMNLRAPYNVGNFLTSSEPFSFSRWTLLHRVSK